MRWFLFELYLIKYNSKTSLNVWSVCSDLHTKFDACGWSNPQFTTAFFHFALLFRIRVPSTIMRRVKTADACRTHFTLLCHLQAPLRFTATLDYSLILRLILQYNIHQDIRTSIPQLSYPQLAPIPRSMKVRCTQQCDLTRVLMVQMQQLCTKTITIHVTMLLLIRMSLITEPGFSLDSHVSVEMKLQQSVYPTWLAVPDDLQTIDV